MSLPGPLARSGMLVTFVGFLIGSAALQGLVGTGKGQRSLRAALRLHGWPKQAAGASMNTSGDETFSCQLFGIGGRPLPDTEEECKWNDGLN